MVPISGMLLLLLIAVPLAFLFSGRTRSAGVVILGLLGIGLFGLFFLRVSHQPSVTIQPDNYVHFPDYVANVSDNVAIDSLPGNAEHLSTVEHAEVLRNQRMAARMQGAFVQTSPNGSTLETYPDGMQISQRASDGFRSVVRAAHGDGQANGKWGSSHSTRSEIKFWIMGAPLLALIVAFIALKRGTRSGGGGFGAGLAVAGVAAMLLLGYAFTFSGSSRHVTFGTPVPPAQTPRAIESEGEAEFDRVHQEMLGNLQDVVQQEPIEALWTKLTAPKIKLDPPVDAEAKATQRELANAAKVILSASAPGADPFTQGWLMNAAKAIMNSTPKGEAPAVQAEVVVSSAPPLAPATTVTPLKVIAASKPAAAEAAGAGTVERTPDKPRPDWIDVPPTLVGNTQRVVVSTDPFVTVEECHAALRDKLRGVVQARVDELARAANGGHYTHTPGLDSMGINIEYILSELCPEDDYIETVNASFGEMKKAHALVEFNETQDRLLLDRWRAYARVQSIEVVAVLSAFVVGGLAFVYGLLKVDTWTRGYYTKRLFLGVPAAIIAVTVGFIVLVETFH